MTTASLPMASVLSWTQWAEQDRRFRRIRTRVLGAVVVFGLLVALLPAPVLKLPETPLAPLPVKIELKPHPLVARPPPPAAHPSEPALAPAATPPKAVVPPRPLKSVKPTVSVDHSGSPPPGPDARQRANAAGIGDLARQLSSLHDSSAASKAITGRPDLTGTPRPTAISEFAGGADAGPGSERALITARAGQSSGGINTAALSRGVGGGALAGRGTTQVAGYGGGGTGSGAGLGRGGGKGSRAGGGGGGGTGNGSGGALGSRSREEIEMVFDRNKGAIYALYNRALRVDPNLQGKMVLELTIQPNGVVTACRVVSSEFAAPDFQKQLVQRVLMFKFEDRDVAPVTTTKPIDFFPT